MADERLNLRIDAQALATAFFRELKQLPPPDSCVRFDHLAQRPLFPETAEAIESERRKIAQMDADTRKRHDELVKQRRAVSRKTSRTIQTTLATVRAGRLGQFAPTEGAVVVVGQVRDEATNTPIPNVRVRAKLPAGQPTYEREVRTTALGGFELLIDGREFARVFASDPSIVAALELNVLVERDTSVGRARLELRRTDRETVKEVDVDADFSGHPNLVEAAELAQAAFENKIGRYRERDDVLDRRERLAEIQLPPVILDESDRDDCGR